MPLSIIIELSFKSGWTTLQNFNKPL